MHRMQCSQIWGGIRNADLDLCTSGLTASLYSGAAHGGKGGDIYYFTLCGEDKFTRVAIADVVGHGSDVSEVSQWLYDALAARLGCLEGDGLLGDLNDMAIQRGLSALTTAAVVGFYAADRCLYYSYAGHPPLLFRRRPDARWQTAMLTSSTGPANLALGVMPAVRYDRATIPLTHGDRLFLYSDGVIEAPDGGSHLFGEERLLSVLEDAGQASPLELKDAVLAAIRRHTGGSMHHDDVTLIAMEVR